MRLAGDAYCPLAIIGEPRGHPHTTEGGRSPRGRTPRYASIRAPGSFANPVNRLPITMTSLQTAPSLPWPATPTVLLIDDEEPVRHLIRTILAPEVCRIVEAVTADALREAVALLVRQTRARVTEVE